jgi:hypothetical protein
VTGYELRPYNNRVVLQGPANNLRAVALAPSCAAIDLNQDAVIDSIDLGIMLSAWGTSVGDVNDDGTTDANDLTFMLNALGSDCRG